MKRSIGTTAATLAALFVLTAAAVGQQTFINEDFSGGVGTTPPAGWSSTDLINSTSTAGPAWRFDNPDGRAIAAPLVAPIAICDSDFLGSGQITARLESPQFDTSLAAVVFLSWDQTHVPLGSTVSVLVDDGTSQTQVYTNSAGTPAGDSQSLNITAACGGSATCSIIFEYDGNFDWFWQVDNVDVNEPAPASDAGVIAISAGAGDCLILTASEAITIEVQNFGTVPLAGAIPVEYNVDAGPPVMEIFTPGAPIVPGATDFYTFTTTADLSSGSATLDARTVLVGDADPLNDELLGVVVANDTIYTLPFAESFDSVADNSVVMPADWINDPNDAGGSGQDVDWEGETAGTLSSGTGPTGPNSGAAYVYVEDGGNFDEVNLISPCMDLTSASLPLLKFALHSLNDNDLAPNTFSVDVISGGAVTAMDFVGPLGEISTNQVDWTSFAEDISAFNGQVVRFQFRVDSNNGWFAHDIALDDVEVAELVFGSGQPPTAGVSLLDINGATEINGFGVGSGSNGPYFSSATGGGVITFTMEGEPGEAISLLEGPLNVGVLTVMGVGQVDIGNPDGMGGVMNVALVADGTVGGLLNNLFIIQPSGTTAISFTVPAFPAPATFTFQAFIRSSTANPPGMMSNAVSVDFN